MTIDEFATFWGGVVSSNAGTNLTNQSEKFILDYIDNLLVSDSGVYTVESKETFVKELLVRFVQNNMDKDFDFFLKVSKFLFRERKLFTYTFKVIQEIVDSDKFDWSFELLKRIFTVFCDSVGVWVKPAHNADLLMEKLHRGGASGWDLFILFEGMKNLKTGGIKYQDWMRLVDLYEDTSELVALPPNYVIELIKNEKEFK